MPADPPGPPRFPSETTLDEAKGFLSLGNTLYRQVRVQFQDICKREDIVKKTTAGSEKWQAAKDVLIRENAHLHAVFFDDVSKVDQKYLSLDVLCTDVTKRMRTADHKMTLADAKNIIGINPNQSREIRDAFYDILKADNFTSKLETGDQHWSDLKQRWIDNSDTVRSVLAQGTEDPEHDNKRKALEIICRDVMKRFRDDQHKRDPSRKKQVHEPESEQAPGTSQRTSSMSPTMPTAPSSPSRPIAQLLPNDLQIDPSLLLAASDPSVAADFQTRNAQEYTPVDYSNNSYAPHAGPIPVFFRLSPFSQTQHLQQPLNQLWLSTLTSGSMQELRALAVKDFPNSVAAQVEGMVSDLNGNDIPYVLDRDDELGAYLTHTSGGKATFSITVAPNSALN